MIIDTLYKLQDKSLIPLMQKSAMKLQDSSKLLKRWVQKGAADAYLEVVWSVAQEKRSITQIYKNCCNTPLHALKRLAFENGILGKDAQKHLAG